MTKKTKHNLNAVNTAKSKSPKFVFKNGEFILDLYRVDLLSKYGTNDEDFLNLLINQIRTAITPQKTEDTLLLINGALAMYQGIKPIDEIECLLVAQMIATHCIAMEMLKRVMLKEQTFEGVDANVNRATKLTRTYTTQVEALRKYRTGGKQTIQVQHVNVNEGGKAIVGNIKGGGGNG